MLAAALKIPPESMSFWKRGSRPVPAEHCPAIERATGGAVRCEDLRPDIDWGVLRATAPVEVEDPTDHADRRSPNPPEPGTLPPADPSLLHVPQDRREAA